MAPTQNIRIQFISVDYDNDTFGIISLVTESKIRPNIATPVFCSYRHFSCVRPTVELSELINAS